MNQKAIKKLIDEEPEYYFQLYAAELKSTKSHLYEWQKNKCRDALIKILKELI